MSQLTVKPVFVGWIALLAQLPLQIFFTLWSGGFFGGMFTSMVLRTDKPSPWPFLIFGGAAFVAIPCVAYLGKKLNYARTEYRFFDDRLEFEEGFLTINKKVIKLKDIKEVNLRKGILQRTCGLGSIYLATMATGTSAGNHITFAMGFGNVSGSGIMVRDVKDPDQVYERIKSLVDTNDGK